MKPAIRNLLFGTWAVLLPVIVAAPAHASAITDIVSHNGSIMSDPAGTGDTQVLLTCPESSAAFSDCTKSWRLDQTTGIQVHEIVWDVQSGGLDVFEHVLNDGTFAWTDYHLHISDGFLFDEPDWIGAPLPPGSQVIETAQDIWILFGSPLQPGQAFSVSFLIAPNTAPGNATLTQFPTISEPGTLALLGLGLLGLGIARQRKAG